MRATIMDIASKAGVSKTTVSFAFNCPDRISRDTYERVMRVANELGYMPDPVARILARRRTGAVGLLLSRPIEDCLRDPHAVEILRGIGSVCRREGLTLEILESARGGMDDAIRNAAVDGIVAVGVAGASGVSGGADLIGRRDLPLVTIDGIAREGTVNVGIDGRRAGAEMMEAALARGHRAIAILSAGDFADGRVAGLTDALARRALPPPGAGETRLVAADATAEAARAAFSDLLSSGFRPSAVLCLSDVQALGVYEECAARGISIPADISVVGFDDIPFAQFLSPALTTVRQSGFDKGARAASALAALIAGGSPESVVLEARLVMRSSLA